MLETSRTMPSTKQLSHNQIGYRNLISSTFLVFGRLDHHDSLSNRIEVVFEGSSVASEGSCEGDGMLHPGHVHGGDG